MLENLTLPLFCVSPLLASLVGLLIIRRLKGEHRKRKPFKKSEKGLRWAGYALQREIDLLEEKLDGLLVLLAVLPPVTMLGYVVSAQRHGDSTMLRMGLLIPCLAASAWIMLRLYSRSNAIRRKRLGMLGEQMVGQTLNELVRDGCFIFHDFPQDGWNIDHIVVSTSGVFCIETKTRRKQLGEDEKWEYRVSYDGTSLSYAGQEFAETRAVRQVRSAARDLEKFLEQRVCCAVPVTPVLTIPGWMVERKGASDVLAVNPKEIRSVVIDRNRPRLSDELVKRIAAAIEAQCRDVEW